MAGASKQERKYRDIIMITSKPIFKVGDTVRIIGCFNQKMERFVGRVTRITSIKIGCIGEIWYGVEDNDYGWLEKWISKRERLEELL